MPNTFYDLSEQSVNYLQELLSLKRNRLDVTKADLENAHISRETKALLTTAIENEQYDINRLINHIEEYKTAINSNIF